MNKRLHSREAFVLKVPRLFYFRIEVRNCHISHRKLWKKLWNRRLLCSWLSYQGRKMQFAEAVEVIMGNVTVSPPIYTPAPKASRCATCNLEYLHPPWFFFKDCFGKCDYFRFPYGMSKNVPPKNSPKIGGTFQKKKVPRNLRGTE